MRWYASRVLSAASSSCRLCFRNASHSVLLGATSTRTDEEFFKTSNALFLAAAEALLAVRIMAFILSARAPRARRRASRCLSPTGRGRLGLHLAASLSLAIASRDCSTLKNL
ncbi:hypothetical protein AAHC03_018917 [Spirometra sp. Aus1]